MDRMKIDRMVTRQGMFLRDFWLIFGGGMSGNSLGKGRRTRSSVAGLCALICLSGALLLSGCGNFFPPLTSGGGGTGGSGGDYLYVGNLGTNPPTMAGFSLASSALTPLSGSPSPPSHCA